MICQIWLTRNSSTAIETTDVKALLSSGFISMGQEIAGRILQSVLLEDVNIQPLVEYLTMYGAAPVVVGAQYLDGSQVTDYEKNNAVFGLHMADYVKIENGVKIISPVENSFFGWPVF